jgi:hypothetical protein
MDYRSMPHTFSYLGDTWTMKMVQGASIAKQFKALAPVVDKDASYVPSVPIEAIQDDAIRKLAASVVDFMLPGDASYDNKRLELSEVAALASSDARHLNLARESVSQLLGELKAPEVEFRTIVPPPGNQWNWPLSQQISVITPPLPPEEDFAPHILKLDDVPPPPNDGWGEDLQPAVNDAISIIAEVYGGAKPGTKQVSRDAFLQALEKPIPGVHPGAVTHLKTAFDQYLEEVYRRPTALQAPYVDAPDNDSVLEAFEVAGRTFHVSGEIERSEESIERHFRLRVNAYQWREMESEGFALDVDGRQVDPDDVTFPATVTVTQYGKPVLSLKFELPADEEVELPELFPEVENTSYYDYLDDLPCGVYRVPDSDKTVHVYAEDHVEIIAADGSRTLYRPSEWPSQDLIYVDGKEVGLHDRIA